MKTLLWLLLLVSGAASAVPCHSIPTPDDRAFYDQAIASGAAEFTWVGSVANQFAGSIIYRRRVAFYGPAYAFSGPPMDVEESALWDALVISALRKGVNHTLGQQTWIDPGTASEWAHGIAWDATYSRMTTKCP